VESFGSFYWLTKKTENTLINTKFEFKKISNKNQNENKSSITLGFGSEVSGIDRIREILEKQKEINKFVRIPMNDNHIRSFNLANSVSIVMYECLRQFSQ